MMAEVDEKFFAWLDGELSAAEAAEMEARVAADPELAAVAEQHRAFAARLGGAFVAVTDAPVPDRLSALLKPRPADIVDFAAARERRAFGRGWGQLPQWAAMAATLVIGVMIGTAVQPAGETGPVDIRDGTLYAAAGLDQSLERQLASAPQGPVRVGMTFRDERGSVCRSFVTDGSSGLACREGSDWRVRGLFAAPEGQAAEYRMASGMDPNLASLIDSTMNGEPFDAEQERQAMERGWR